MHAQLKCINMSAHKKEEEEMEMKMGVEYGGAA